MNDIWRLSATELASQIPVQEYLGKGGSAGRPQPVERG